MLAVDTNVLLRALVDDPEAMAQCRAARAEMAQHASIYIAQVVQVELAWVMRRALGFSPAIIAQTLERLRSHAALTLQAPDAFDAALTAYRHGQDFADAMIAFEAGRIAAELVTFDRKLAKLAGVRLLATR